MFQFVKALFRRPGPARSRRAAPSVRRLSVEALEARAVPAALPWDLNTNPEIRPVGHTNPELRPVAPVSILLPSLKLNDRLGILLPALRPFGNTNLGEILPIKHVNPEWRR